MSTLFAGLPSLFTQVLGTAAIYTPAAGGEPVMLRGIFNAAFILIELQDGISVESSKPVITIKTSDAPLAKRGDSIEVNSTVYSVRGVEPDGRGMTMLVLGR